MRNSRVHGELLRRDGGRDVGPPVISVGRRQGSGETNVKRTKRCLATEYKNDKKRECIKRPYTRPNQNENFEALEQDATSFGVPGQTMATYTPPNGAAMGGSPFPQGEIWRRSSAWSSTTPGSPLGQQTPTPRLLGR